MRTEELLQETLKGLLTTAVDKVCVLGKEDALEDLTQIRNMYVELVRFWTLDEELIDRFDERIAQMK